MLLKTTEIFFFPTKHSVHFPKILCTSQTYEIKTQSGKIVANSMRTMQSDGHILSNSVYNNNIL